MTSIHRFIDSPQFWAVFFFGFVLDNWIIRLDNFCMIQSDKWRPNICLTFLKLILFTEKGDRIDVCTSEFVHLCGGTRAEQKKRCEREE